MSYIVFLILAVVFAALAAVLIAYERKRTPAAADSQRARWAQQREFIYRPTDPSLEGEFHRGGMVVPGDPRPVEVAHGAYFGANSYVFDLGDVATVVALDRGTTSGVLLDLRPTTTVAPVEPGMVPLGSLGPRVLYTNSADVARRVADRRMAAFADQVPLYVESVWNEGSWTLARIPATDDPDDLDETLEVVRRFSDLLRVLPPEGHARVRSASGPRDPGQPVPTRAQGGRR